VEPGDELVLKVVEPGEELNSLMWNLEKNSFFNVEPGENN
jgi:hypothetical protein